MRDSYLLDFQKYNTEYLEFKLMISSRIFYYSSLLGILASLLFVHSMILYIIIITNKRNEIMLKKIVY